MQKTAIITGSTAGIGLAIAHQFAEKGYNVVFNGLEQNGASIAADVANRYRIDHIFSPADMRDHASLKQMVADTLDRWGRIDVLLNNAGIQHVASIEAFPPEKWDELLHVNLTAPFYLIQAVWPAMKRQKSGRIINMASAHALVASPLKSAYVSAKHGLLGLTKTAALEGADCGITVNAICPGYVDTKLVSNQIKDLAAQQHRPEDQVTRELFLQKHAIKEFVSTDSIGGLCLFLASDQAASITGAAFPVDAGWTAL